MHRLGVKAKCSGRGRARASRVRLHDSLSLEFDAACDALTVLFARSCADTMRAQEDAHEIIQRQRVRDRELLRVLSRIRIAHEHQEELSESDWFGQMLALGECQHLDGVVSRSNTVARAVYRNSLRRTSRSQPHLGRQHEPEQHSNLRRH